MRVAIVGAGICGLFLTKELSKENEVFVFEKREIVGQKPCSCLLSKRVFNFFPNAKNLVKNKIEGCKIYFPCQLKSWRPITFLKFKNPFFCFERKELEECVFSQVKSKAKFYFNFEVKPKTLFDFQKEFDRIVGADGATSVVRKFLGKEDKNFLIGILAFEKKEDFSNFVEVFAKKDGFFWKIPKGKITEWGALGKKETILEFEEFLKKREIEVFEKKAAPILQDFFLPFDEKITLCGEAAGLTKPWSGGGIIWGLKLAQILIKNFPNFKKYKKEAEKFFLPEIAISKILKKLVYFLGFKIPFFLPKNAKIDGDFFFRKA